MPDAPLEPARHHPPARWSAARSAGTVGWALLPLIPALGAPIACAVAAGRRPSARTIVPLVLYPAAFVGFIAFILPFPVEATPGWADAGGLVSLLASTVGASAHLFAIRRYVWAPWEPRPRSPRPPKQTQAGDDWVAPALDRAARLRQDARRLAEGDPALAKRSGVGRPELPRQIDDGGLVDVNHAPVEVLRELPGFNEATARLVRERVERLGPFQNIDEVIVEIDIAPGFERHLREYALLMP
ncbi:ComEA family DNA-binding protein [Glycomyces sp. NPDC048151]|uniref:ComEA family DNA-binding protein n=1 Tax=Glycomyces sp. NPDC048151 TaxID=3364002 RepID=UPI003710C144